jgi:gamma-glutamylcyclotransferase
MRSSEDSDMTKVSTGGQSPLFYFAYGSNMAVARLASRVPAARKYANAELKGYSLCFHKVSTDGSGKCDIALSDRPDAVVYGVLFSVQDADLCTLDRIEGSGYRRVYVDVATATGAILRAATYVATQTDAGLRPYCWYREHVLRGAITNGLPVVWIAMLEAVACDKDPDRARHLRELAIYTE